MNKKRENTQEKSFLDSLLSLPRVTRIMLAVVFAIAVTLAISPVADNIYLQSFFSEETRILPSLVSAGFGLVMYAAGYVTLVGVVGEDVEARRITWMYLVVSALAVVVVMIWTIRLVMIGGGT